MATTKIPSRRGPRNVTPVSGKEKLRAIRRLLGYVFRYYPWQFALVLLFVLLSSLGTVFGSYFVGNILVDGYIKGSIGPNFNDGLIQTPTSGLFAGIPFPVGIALLAGVYLVAVLSSYFYNMLMSVVGQGVQKKIRDELFNHMQDLPVSYFDSRTHGDIMSVYTNDVDALREMLARALPMVVQSLVTMVVCFIMMLMTDLVLTAVVLVFALLMFFFTRYFTKLSSKYFVSQQIELGKMNGYIEEMTNGQRVVKVFNYEDRNIAGFKEHNDAYFNDAMRANRAANILMPAVNQLGNLQYAFLAMAGALMIMGGVPSVSLQGIEPFTIGLVVSFLLYAKSFVQPIGQVSQQLNVMALAVAGASRIFQMIDVPVETDEGYVELCYAEEGPDGNPVEVDHYTGRWAWKHPHKDGGETSYVWLRGKITFDHVDFSYIPGKQILHDVTLWAKPGQKVAFVGPTGAGKTTIANLINRFYDIEDGKIRYDDININKIKKADLRRSLGIVLQDTKLFTGTVKENIRFGNLHATDEEVVAAAKLANADSFIRLLPDGYDTMLLNGGSGLSQGQRQLLAIARAAVANPPAMILDEATSSIDSRTEALVQEGMDAIMKGRTVFVIAHRLSTIKNSDVIMVIDHGRIIERGSHEELIAKKGKYYQLYTGNAMAEKEA